jgi:FAD/FMN-containing dehydrogenase
MGSQGSARHVATGVLRPGDDGFDEARSIWNGRFDRRPAAVVRCGTGGDVAAAVAFARAEGLPVSVKSGGHAYAANTVAEGSLLVDLSPMKAVRVDAETRSAVAEAGVLCGELDAATQAHRLATPLPTVSSVGVAGAALGGGSGYLSRRYGLALDNLLSVDVVTAEGSRLRAAEDEHPDLFWAMRGAGANFGIATSLEFRLHEVGPLVLSGQVVYPFERAGELLRLFREFMSDAPDELQCYPFMFRIPPVEPFPEQWHGRFGLDFVLCHLDPTATDAVQPLRELGESVLELVGPTPYADVQRSFDAGLPAGQRYDSRAFSLDGLSDTAIDTIVEHVPGMQGTFTAAYLEPPAPAVAAVDASATAFAGRTPAWGFHILAGWTDPGEDESILEWTHGFRDAMASHAASWVYVNLLAEDEQDRVPAAYGDQHRRLGELKAAWDPDNLFRANHNIEPVR